MSEQETTLQNSDAAIAEAAAKEAMAEVGEAEAAVEGGAAATAEEQKADEPEIPTQEVDFENEEMKYTGTAYAKG